jgi:hypothetical protein
MMDSASSPTGEFTHIEDGSNVHISRSLLHYVCAYLRLLTGNAAILPPILPTSLPALLPAIRGWRESPKENGSPTGFLKSYAWLTPSVLRRGKKKKEKKEGWAETAY